MDAPSKIKKNEDIRDKLILELRDSDLQKKLLMDDEIELAAVEKTIVSAELAAKQRQTVPYSGGSRRDGHDWNNHFNAVCNFCKRKGHIRKNCCLLNRNSGKFVEESQIGKEEINIDKFNRMRLRKSSDESDISCMKVDSVNSVNDPCLVNACVESQSLLMEIDTGSAVAVITKYYTKNSSIPFLFRIVKKVGCGKRCKINNYRANFSTSCSNRSLKF